MRDKEELLVSAYLILATNWFIQTVLFPLGTFSALVSTAALALAGLMIGAYTIYQKGSDIIKGNKFLAAFLAYVLVNCLIIAVDKRLPYSWASFALIASALIVFAGNRIRLRPHYLWISFGFVVLYSALVAMHLEHHVGVSYYRLKFAMSGWESNPNVIGMSLMPIAVASFYLPKQAAIVSLLLIGWIFGLCFSMAIFLGSALAIVFLSVVRPSARRLAPYHFIGILAGCATAIYLSSDGASKISTAATRLGIWQAFIELGLQRPWIGHGFLSDVTVTATAALGHKQDYRFAHNGIIHLFVQGGFVGVIFFAGVVYETAIRILRLVKRESYYSAAFALSAAPYFLTVNGALLYWLPAMIFASAGVVMAAMIEENSISARLR